MEHLTAFLLAALAALALLAAAADVAIVSLVPDDLDLTNYDNSIKDLVGANAVPGNTDNCWYTRSHRAHCSGDCEYDLIDDAAWCKTKSMQKYGKLWCQMCWDKKPKKCI